MPPRPARPPRTPYAPPSTAAFGWLFAIVAPAVPLAVCYFSHTTVAPEVQRLSLLAMVALVATTQSRGPALLSIVVATALGWFRLETLRFSAAESDGATIVVFFFVALVIAAAITVRRAGALLARELAARADSAEREAAGYRAESERLEETVTRLRTSLTRAESDASAARADADRAREARRALLDSLPHDLRAPHVQPPAPLQLFPPIFTTPPRGTE